MSTDDARERITFEDGYAELKAITDRLAQEDVSVHEMFEGFRRGKGLERSLRAYLTEREGELTEIEAGRNLPEFDIVAPSAGGGRLEDVELSAGGGSDDFRAARLETAGTDDEIPF